MPADIIGGFITYVKAQAGLEIWDGEVPREGEDGTRIKLEGGPVVQLEMTDAGFEGDWNMSDTYTDDGVIFFTIWSTTRKAAYDIVHQLEELLVKESNFQAIEFNITDFECYKVIRTNWGVVQEKSIRSHLGKLVYRGFIYFDVGINAHASTR